MTPTLSPLVKTETKLLRVAFYTLGCKLNFSETATIARDFDTQNFKRVAFESPADVYVINTCSVTDNADKRLKGIVQKALTQNPEGFIAIIGCYAQLQPQQIAAMEGVDLVLGASEKFKLFQYIHDLKKKEIGEVHACEIADVNFYESSFSISDRTRAFLKVQDGCDYKCSYCTIPLARGISRSDTLNKVIENATKIANEGIREIVLTGVNIGDYGKGEFGNKKHEHTFLELIQALDHVANIERIRISSIEPNLLSSAIIDHVAESNRFVPHFHIPLQSGSDRILKRMRRRYMSELYTERIQRIRKKIPDACIGVDVIVGFPGETEEDFLTTYSYLAALPVSYLHVFTYSERPNTEAVGFSGAVPASVRNQRSKMLRALSVKKRRAFYESQLGNTAEVLFESENKKGYIHGFTENYVKVRSPWNPNWVNVLKKVKLDQIDDEGFVRFEVD
ncbi:MAG: tRNA (N(6)-L-threonylcarbamoyladenosine(37)-C(2))-methylthiotransferase MtaB [Flavobacteriia bacterium]|nr:tRNA (N(6)-L-threonylcarbamoyladenosine(37)-C(2))-methylthiotransferase MtaB [Flavobacteriia bacterium]